MATLSEVESAQLNMLTMKMQRDINCLSDPDRNVRRRALDKLQRSIKNEIASTTTNVLRVLCRSHMQTALLTCAGNDPVEKCREKAIVILLGFAEGKALELSDTTLRELVALVSSRIGKLPYAEPTEEIRLLLLQLLKVFLVQLSQLQDDALVSLRDVMPDLANALGKAALDPFPDVKKMAADCCITVSKRWRSDVALQLGTIVKPTITNLGHQHSRVRVCALQVGANMLHYDPRDDD